MYLHHKKLPEPASSAGTCTTSEYGNNSIDKDFFDTLDRTTASSQVTGYTQQKLIKVSNAITVPCG